MSAANPTNPPTKPAEQYYDIDIKIVVAGLVDADKYLSEVTVEQAIIKDMIINNQEIVLDDKFIAGTVRDYEKCKKNLIPHPQIARLEICTNAKAHGKWTVILGVASRTFTWSGNE